MSLTITPRFLPPMSASSTATQAATGGTTDRDKRIHNANLAGFIGLGASIVGGGIVAADLAGRMNWAGGYAFPIGVVTAFLGAGIAAGCFMSTGLARYGETH
ncbi:MAG: hypothetical protein H7287_03505 [Thermoleophilia bacterium]|nr:hypothetical protein [Thermoleophilia bacterium]